MEEELQEFIDAFKAGDLTEMADALGDLLYVTYGTAVEAGIPINRIFQEIHRSNMTKVPADGKIRRRADGKVLKPVTWEPPRLKPILGIDI